MSALLPALTSWLQPNVQTPPLDYDGVEYRFGRVVFRPAEFKNEALVFAAIGVYFAIYFVNAYLNKKRANAWLTAHMALYEAQFSRPTNVSGSLIEDGAADFYNFSTGRRGVTSLHTVFAFLPRHDLLQTLLEFGRGILDLNYNPSDEVTLDFKLSSSGNVPNFVWGVVQKDDIMKIREDRWDMKFPKAGDSNLLPPNLGVLTEFSDVTEQLLRTNPLLSLKDILSDPVRSSYFRSLVVSDQPLTAPDGPTTLLDQPKHVVLTLRVPPTSDVAATLPLVQAVFSLVDYLDSKYLVLRPETRTKLRKSRLDMEEELKKQEKKDDVDNAVEKKREAKRKAEQERIAKLSAAEQKKHDERERKRTMRRIQTRGASVRKA